MTPAAESNAEGKRHRSRRFPKSHRLKHRRLIRSLFDRDVSGVQDVSCGSIRAVFRFVPVTEASRRAAAVQTAFFVGRKTGNAVRRNKVRRRVREAYRQMHGELLEIVEKRSDVLALGLVFRGKGDESFDRIAADVSGVVKAVSASARQHGGRNSVTDAGLR